MKPDEGPKAENDWPAMEGERPTTEDKRPKTEDERLRIEDERPMSADGGCGREGDDDDEERCVFIDMGSHLDGNN